MSLAEDIQALRDRALADLAIAHDYFTESKAAWRIVHKLVKAGRKFTVRNTSTGTVTTHADLIAKARGYVTEQLAETTFQQFISIFEAFLFDLLRLWLAAFPKSLGRKQVAFEEILDAPDKDAITLVVVGKELNEVLYRRPADWFEYLEAKAHLGCPTADEIDRIAEAKATRDALVHNRGVAGKSYALKAGVLARYAQGATIEVPESYHRLTWDLLRKVVADLSNAAIGKAP